MDERIAAFSLGSNMGNRLGMLRLAVSGMRAFLGTLRTSRVWETEPWGDACQPRFLNMAVTAQTSLSCAELLCRVKDIEKRLGRVKTRRWGPRLIDIDILIVGDEVVNTSELIIPHPRMCERAFALRPLAEIGGSLIHPVSKRSVAELLAEIPSEKMEWVTIL